MVGVQKVLKEGWILLAIGIIPPLRVQTRVLPVAFTFFFGGGAINVIWKYAVKLQTAKDFENNGTWLIEPGCYFNVILDFGVVAPPGTGGGSLMATSQ